MDNQENNAQMTPDDAAFLRKRVMDILYAVGTNADSQSRQRALKGVNLLFEGVTKLTLGIRMLDPTMLKEVRGIMESEEFSRLLGNLVPQEEQDRWLGPKHKLVVVEDSLGTDDAVK